jgi:predicted NUDIX family NTP pyrophosphohydrolase
MQSAKSKTSKRESAGLMMYRLRDGVLEILLVHPGGPFWKNKDVGAWSIPKGEVNEGEDLLEAAKREFFEELGILAAGPFQKLGSVKQKGGKIVHAWAFEGDCDPAQIRCGTNVEIVWPPRSGNKVAFPEVDRAEFFKIESATQKINPAQVSFLQRLIDHVTR